MNNKHPELLEGEVFLSNTTEEEFKRHFGYKSKRLGNTAYNIRGESVPGLRPVFVSKAEYDEYIQSRAKRR